MMKKTISSQLILLLCLVITALAVVVGINFSLSKNFDAEILKEKRQALDTKLKTISKKLEEIPIDDWVPEKLLIAIEPIVEENTDIKIGYFDNDSNEEWTVFWDEKNGRVEIIEKPMDIPHGKPKNEGTIPEWPEVRRDREKIWSKIPLAGEEGMVGVLWIEDSIISDIDIFRRVRLFTGIVVAASILTGILGAVYIIRRLMRDIRNINNGIEEMKGNLSYRIDESSNELGQIAGEINRMADRLEEQKILEERLHQADKMAAVGQFVSGIAHELKNPLGIMKGSIQLMEREGSFSEESAVFVGVIKEQIERQNKVLEELLNFAKPSEPNFEVLDVEELLDSIMVFSGAYLRDLKIELERIHGTDLPKISGDSEKLKQVFLNLILNAVQAMPDGGILSIETEASGENMVSVRFRDSGNGIPEKELSDIFNPYFTTKDEGTGLGLSISYRLVQLHGGVMEAENLKGGGMLFTVSLPGWKA